AEGAVGATFGAFEGVSDVADDLEGSPARSAARTTVPVRAVAAWTAGAAAGALVCAAVEDVRAVCVAGTRAASTGAAAVAVAVAVAVDDGTGAARTGATSTGAGCTAPRSAVASLAVSTCGG